MMFMQGVCGQGSPGEEAQQDGRGASDGQVGPLALGLQAQMCADLLEGDISAAGSVQSRSWGSKVPPGSRISIRRMVTASLPERYQAAVWEVSSTMRVAPWYQDTAATVQAA